MSGLMQARDVERGMWVERRDDQGAWRFHQVSKTVQGFGSVLLGFADHVTKQCAPTAELVVFDGDGDPNEVVSPRRNVPGWDDYFLGVADAIAVRAKCRRRQVGAVIVGQDRRILSTGYNGAPSGLKDCLEGGCPRGLTSYGSVEARSPYDDPTSAGFCPAVHAELNALLYAGRDVRGCTVYVTDAPCPNCTKHLAGAGVERVVWRTSEGSTSGDPKVMLLARQVEPDNVNRRSV